MAIDYNSTAITPNRKTRLDCDINNIKIAEEAWTCIRNGAEVAKPSQRGNPASSNVSFRAGGIWTLKMVQEQIGNLQEYTDFQELVIVTGGGGTIGEKWNHNPSFLEVTKDWRPSSDLTGMTYESGHVAEDKGFLRPKFAAGVNITGAIIPHNPPPPAKVVQQVPMSRYGVSQDVYAENQGFFLRWVLPGKNSDHPFYVILFDFGQYSLAIKGNGTAELFEYCRDSAGVFAYRERASFQYSRQANISDAAHSMAIYPFAIDNNRYISFIGNALDGANYISGQVSSDQDRANVTEFIYMVDSGLRGGDLDESPGFVTKSGVISFSIRRDLRPKIQISKLGYALSGVIEDLPDALPPFISNLEPLTMEVYGTQPAGTSISTEILDADTGTTFIPGTHHKLYVKITLTGNGLVSPAISGYALKRKAVTVTNSPGEFFVNSDEHLLNISVSSGGGDISPEYGNVVISDRKGELTKLRTRGEFACKLVVEYNPPDEVPQDIILLRGSLVRPKSTFKGKPIGTLSGGFGNGVEDECPSNTYHDISAPLLGVWYQLQKRVETRFFRQFKIDPLQTDQPYKVTSAMIEVLKSSGFSADMIDIPDLPYRLYSGRFNKQADDVIQAGSQYGNILQTWSRNYLGAYLYFEPNAGDNGKWKLLYRPKPTSANVWTFTNEPSCASLPPHLESAYSSLVSPIFSMPEYEVIPPEFNLVYVCCPVPLEGRSNKIVVANYASNPKSFDVPGFTTTADPDNEDYIGESRPLVIVDTSLAGVGGNGQTAFQQTQNAVNFMVRRLYDFTCHAQKVVRFTAPFVFLNDASIGKYRPIRFGDCVDVMGEKYYINSVSANWNNERMQLASYECLRVF